MALSTWQQSCGSREATCFVPMWWPKARRWMRETAQSWQGSRGQTNSSAVAALCPSRPGSLNHPGAKPCTTWKRNMCQKRKRGGAGANCSCWPEEPPRRVGSRTASTSVGVEEQAAPTRLIRTDARILLLRIAEPVKLELEARVRFAPGASRTPYGHAGVDPQPLP